MTTRCPGCGLELAEHDGPTHPSIGASPACWALYGEGLAALPGSRLLVDACAVQHPGVPEPRSIQSVGVHLMVLCLAFERSVPPDRLLAPTRRLLDARLDLRRLEPPDPNGTLTIRDVTGPRRSSPGPATSGPPGTSTTRPSAPRSRPRSPETTKPASRAGS